MSDRTQIGERSKQVLALILETESQLRGLAADQCYNEWGDGWQEVICQRYHALANEWHRRRERARADATAYNLPLGTLLDHSTLWELKDFIRVEWRLFREVFDFEPSEGSDIESLNRYLGWMLTVRNCVAHNRPVHTQQLDRATVACGEIRMQLAKWKGERPWVGWESAREPDRIALCYFVRIEDYLTRRGPHFPKESDFAAQLVYLPEEHASLIGQMLGDNQRCLLLGRSASGKTVLAIALGKQLRDVQGYRVYYGDAGRAQVGDGRDWYREVCDNDQDGVLYILDNCHLAAQEVNEFCFLWENMPPAHTKVLLVSRRGAGDHQLASAEAGDYFDTWADVAVGIEPEELYMGIVRQYAAAYLERDPRLYTPLESDSQTLLKAQHAHNLIVSKSRLEAWRQAGGRLSKVKQQAVYEALIRKYLSHAPEALVALCALWQFEIPAHNSFVDRALPSKEVDWLVDENLVARAILPSYGLVYQLLFHAEEAGEILEASVYRQWGRVDPASVRTQTSNVLRAYLRASPSNYASVYDRLHQEKQRDIEQQLLADCELQACAAEHLQLGSIRDAALYISRLRTVDGAAARQVVDQLVQTVGIDSICGKLSELTYRDIGQSLKHLEAANSELVQAVVAGLNMKRLGRLAGSETRQDLFWLSDVLDNSFCMAKGVLLQAVPAQTLATMVQQSSYDSLMNFLRSLARRGYPRNQRKKLVEALDMQQLAQRFTRGNLVGFMWLCKSLHRLVPEQVKTLIESIPTSTLAARFTEGDFGAAAHLLRHLVEFGYPQERRQELLAALDLKQIAARAGKEGLQPLFWLIRAIKGISPEMAEQALETITPAGLVSLCRSLEATTQALGDFSRLAETSYRIRFFREFSNADIIDIFARSPLAGIGLYLQHHYFYHRLAYEQWKEMQLAERLATEPVDQIVRFLCSLIQIPEVGLELADNALDLLSIANLVARFSSADDIGAWGQLIHIAAETDEQHLGAVRSALQDWDMPSKLAASDLKGLSTFVWEVFEHLDPDMAVRYCEIVDAQLEPGQLITASSDALCHFLWNMVQITDRRPLQILERPAVVKRLMTSWESEAGPAATLLGILITVQPDVTTRMTLPPIESPQEMQASKWLARNFKDRDRRFMGPILIALAVRGLRAHNESQARELVAAALPIARVHGCLYDVAPEVITPQSQSLLQEALEWLATILFEETVALLDEAQQALSRQFWGKARLDEAEEGFPQL